MERFRSITTVFSLSGQIEASFMIMLYVRVRYLSLFTSDWDAGKKEL